jgi:hypothetical protein
MLMYSEPTMSRSTTNDLVSRLEIRAGIRRSISTRKSVQEGKPDRLADLLDEAAKELKRLYELTGSRL